MKKNNTKETYLAVQLSSSRLSNKPSNRFVLWIDERWYETTNGAAFVVPESQIEQVKVWLKNHFIYYATFVYQNGNKVEWSGFKKPKPKATFTLGANSGISFILKR